MHSASNKAPRFYARVGLSRFRCQSSRRAPTVHFPVLPPTPTRQTPPVPPLPTARAWRNEEPVTPRAQLFSVPDPPPPSYHITPHTQGPTSHICSAMSWLAKKDHNQSRGRRASSSRTATSEAVLLISPSAFRASSQSASSSSVAHSIYEDELDAMPDIVDDDVLLLCISALPLRSPKPVRAVVSDSSPGPSSVSSSLHGPHGGRRSPYSPLRPGGRSANASPTLGGRPPTFRAVVPAGLRTKSPSPIPGSFGDRNTRRGNINPASFADQATLLQQVRTSACLRLRPPRYRSPANQQTDRLRSPFTN